MAATGKHVLKNASIKVNSVDLSDHCKKVTVNQKYDEVDVSAMGDTAKVTALGLSDSSFDVDFYQDFASGKVDATMFPLNGGSQFLVEVWPDGTTTSPTNPKFSATVILPNYGPLDGDIGSADMISVTFKAQQAIARATA
jgi:hypothetical protein